MIEDVSGVGFGKGERGGWNWKTNWTGRERVNASDYQGMIHFASRAGSHHFLTGWSCCIGLMSQFLVKLVVATYGGDGDGNGGDTFWHFTFLSVCLSVCLSVSLLFSLNLRLSLLLLLLLLLLLPLLLLRPYRTVPYRTVPAVFRKKGAWRLG